MGNRRYNFLLRWGVTVEWQPHTFWLAEDDYMSNFWSLGHNVALWCALVVMVSRNATQAVEVAEQAPAAAPSDKADAVNAVGEVQVSENDDDEIDADPSENSARNKPPSLPPPDGAKELSETDRVWVDVKKRVVYVDGYVSLREGVLEMFACTAGTKEHESIVAVLSRAHVVHAALLAVGAKEGKPVQFQPRYTPPTGTSIDIEVRWRDAEEKWHHARAQDWVREVETKKPMEQKFVFAGSAWMKDEATGKQYYLAEGGDFICVSNFSSAMIDVPIESSHANDGLLFQANPDVVPDLGTPVRLVLAPRVEETQDKAK